jgi:hypothetical protein
MPDDLHRRRRPRTMSEQIDARSALETSHDMSSRHEVLPTINIQRERRGLALPTPYAEYAMDDV